ncbi:MAG TPA: hypothetical protein VLT61_07795, partial [Anaeromyxobacteraceae bacterium]|nr:hypothetical protein [Anaeromyxobacteraceae bacterium]
RGRREGDGEDDLVHGDSLLRGAVAPCAGARADTAPEGSRARTREPGDRQEAGVGALPRPPPEE